MSTYRWTQADRTPGLDALANDWGELELLRQELAAKICAYSGPHNRQVARWINELAELTQRQAELERQMSEMVRQNGGVE